MRLGSAPVAVALLVAIGIGEGGCAIMMQQSPKENRAPGEMPVCSTGRGGVVLDGLIATVLGAGALIGFANEEPGVGLGLGAVSGIYIYSAVSGHRSADRCEAAVKEYRTEMEARRDLPPTRGPVASPEEEAAPPRPAGPSIEEAAPAEQPPVPAEEPPPAEEPATAAAPEPPAAPPPAHAPRDWSDFWIEVKK